jgi:hypothetical protein
MRNKIFVCKDFDRSIPVLLIDFNKEYISDDYVLQAEAIINNLKDSTTDILLSVGGEAIIELHTVEYNLLGDWFAEQELFIKNMKSSLNGSTIQLCGIFRELCLVEVAALLNKHGIKAIIIDNDDYSISATCSVDEGDTLENRINEVGCQLEYI